MRILLTRRAVAKLALIATILVAATASSAAASDLSLEQLDYEQYAVDGSDFYWMRNPLQDREVCPSKAQILRRDLLGGPTKVIASFYMKCDVEIGWLEAGGGRVAYERQVGHFAGYRSKVISMDRNGEGRRVLASGTFHGTAYLDRPNAACGQSVGLVSGTESGAFVVSTVTQTSTAKGCRNQRNGQTARYSAVYPDGTRRRIYSLKKGKPKDLFGRWLPEAVQLNGDHAAIVSAGTRRVRAVDLRTGMVTAPLPDSVSVQKKKILSIQVSVGPDGEVVVNSPEPQPKETLGYMATDLFPTPTNPTFVVRKNRSGAAVYCGARLIAEQSIDEAFPTDQLVELDPLTLEVKIVLAQVTAGSVIEGCSSKAVTLSSQPNSRDVLHSVALGG